MNNENVSRFQGAIWFDEIINTNILVGGCGGIGSWLVLLLNRTGATVSVADHDSLERRNMSGQLFSEGQIGNSKVEAMGQVLRLFGNSKKYYLYKKFIDVQFKIKPNTIIVVSAFDNMQARKNLFEAWVNFVKYLPDREKMIFIDGRLLAQQYQIICIRGDKDLDKEVYKRYLLFSDEEVEEVACTFKQTSHVAALIAGKMTALITNHIANIAIEDSDFAAVPFYTEELTDIQNYIRINTSEDYEEYMRDKNISRSSNEGFYKYIRNNLFTKIYTENKLVNEPTQFPSEIPTIPTHSFFTDDYVTAESYANVGNYINMSQIYQREMPTSYPIRNLQDDVRDLHTENSLRGSVGIFRPRNRHQSDDLISEVHLEQEETEPTERNIEFIDDTVESDLSIESIGEELASDQDQTLEV
jgi:molybdopterin/thiamine biosynthesis adenylyltransferase